MSETSTVVQIPDAKNIRRASAGKALNKREAEALTLKIKTSAAGLWQLVSEAHDRKAWKALGFDSWKAYATTELQMSESRSFQLVDQGRVMRAIGEVVGDPEAVEVISVTARETAKVKPHIASFKSQVKQLVKDGLTTEEAVRQAIKGLPVSEPKPRGKKHDPRVIEHDADEPVGIPAQAGEPELIDLAAQIAERDAAAKRQSGPVAPALFVPEGNQVCDCCKGLGYVALDA